MRQAPASALLLDFDGTLAPFRVDPSKSRPWAGVAALLEGIRQTGRTHIAIISGRPAREVAALLGMHPQPEIWGLHGAERVWPDGRAVFVDLPETELQRLAEAKRRVHAAVSENQLKVRIEEKSNAVVAHWRGAAAAAANMADAVLTGELRGFAETHAGWRMMQFDGGIELRSGRDKGDAVRAVLSEMAADAPVAYLGDDVTDEDAFQALEGRGLGILVRRVWRPTAATVWLRPPSQLRAFLGRWLAAVRE